MSSDGILTDGPLAQYVSSDTIDLANWLHHINFDILFYAIILHVVAIIAYKIKGKPRPKMVKQSPVANTRQYWSTFPIIVPQFLRYLPTTIVGAYSQ